jgi:hypothetical protein
MVALTAPTPEDVICDPAAGTCGFLVAAGEYLRETHPGLFRNDRLRSHFHHGMFNGFDFDATMLRIGAMNMTLHGVEDPEIAYRDSLAEDHAEDAGAYSLVLANPPFAGSLDYETTAKDLLKIVKTKKTELLFVALFLRLLRTGGRAAVIVPDGVLFGSSTAHKEIRRQLVEEHKLDAVIKLPSGVFRPYAGVSTAILLFTKTGVGGTGSVWFYDMTADGFSLDDKRTPLLDEAKLGPRLTLGTQNGQIAAGVRSIRRHGTLAAPPRDGTRAGRSSGNEAPWHRQAPKPVGVVRTAEIRPPAGCRMVFPTAVADPARAACPEAADRTPARSPAACPGGQDRRPAGSPQARQCLAAASPEVPARQDKAPREPAARWDPAGRPGLEARAAPGRVDQPAPGLARGSGRETRRRWAAWLLLLEVDGGRDGVDRRQAAGRRRSMVNRRAPARFRETAPVEPEKALEKRKVEGKPTSGARRAGP